VLFLWHRLILVARSSLLALWQLAVKVWVVITQQKEISKQWKIDLKNNLTLADPKLSVWRTWARSSTIREELTWRPL
jgi:hypothetical protein